MRRMVRAACALFLVANAGAQTNPAPVKDMASTAKTASQQSLDNFKRSLSACLDSRGYSVK
jgi:hypothetical protein